MSVTIKDLGVVEYLNRTESQHYGYGGQDFIGFIERGVSTQGIADIYGVTWNTAKSWVKQFKEESKNVRSTAN